MNTMSFKSMLNAAGIEFHRNGNINKFVRGNVTMIVTGTLDTANVMSVCNATLDNKRAPKGRKALASDLISVAEQFREQLAAMNAATKDIVADAVAAAKAAAPEIRTSTTKNWLTVWVGDKELYFNRSEIASKGMLAVVETVGKAVKDEAVKAALRQLYIAVRGNPTWWHADAITRRDFEWRTADMLAKANQFGGTFASTEQAGFYHQMKQWLAEHSQAA